MNDELNERAVMGGNNLPPPAYDITVWERHRAKALEFADAAGAWLDLKVIETAEQSAKLTDFVDGARKVSKIIDDARKDEKKPHDAAGKKVQDAYLPILKIVADSVEKVSVLQTDWLRRENARLQAIRIENERIAAEEKERAERELEAAKERNDIAGVVEAESNLKAAAKDVKRAAKPVKVSASSATGGGRGMSMRKQYSCELVDKRLAFARFGDHPNVQQALIAAANEEVRAMSGEKSAPAGFALKITEVAV